MPKLPPELIDIIIVFLHDNRSALSNFSLTSRAWLPSCRAQLFKNINLTEGLFAPFLRLLQGSPHLGKFVKTFAVVPESAEDYSSVCDILQYLGAVEELLIEWMQGSLPTASLFSGVGPVQKLEIATKDPLDDLSVLASFLNAFPNIQDLSVVFLNDGELPIDEVGLQELIDSLSRLRLRSLEVGGVASDVVKRCLHIRPQPLLETLKCIVLLNTEWLVLPDILLTMTTSVKELSLNAFPMPYAILDQGEFRIQTDKSLSSQQTFGRYGSTEAGCGILQSSRCLSPHDGYSSYQILHRFPVTGSTVSTQVYQPNNWFLWRLASPRRY